MKYFVFWHGIDAMIGKDIRANGEIEIDFAINSSEDVKRIENMILGQCRGRTNCVLLESWQRFENRKDESAWIMADDSRKPETEREFGSPSIPVLVIDDEGFYHIAVYLHHVRTAETRWRECGTNYKLIVEKWMPLPPE